MHLVVFDVDGTLVESDEFDGILYARLGWDFVGIGDGVRHHRRFRDYRDYESIEAALAMRSPVG